MREKKQFFIPKNYDKKFELIPGISGLANLVFIPVLGFDYFLLAHTPFELSNKITFLASTIAIPYVLIANRPVRENVSLYKHLLWRLKFQSRQRIFKYRKEGYYYAIEQEKNEERSNQKREINSRSNSDQSDRKRFINYG